MAKSKIISKKTVTLAAMVVALGAAIFLNMKYSGMSADNIATGSGSKYLGEALYVGADATASKDNSSSDYFSSAVSEREKTREEAIALLEEIISDAKLTKEQKTAAVDALAEISDDKTKEAAIESLIKAKGFEKVAVILGDDNVSVVVATDHELLDSESMQITDAVISQVDVELENIKIIKLK